MRVTPLDIIQKQFTANRRGYEPDEVRAFLEETRETLEDLLKENQRLREQIARFEAEIAELRSEEHEVKETLQLARQVKEEMERTARRESDVVLGEARLEAEKIIMAAGDEGKMGVVNIAVVVGAIVLSTGGGVASSGSLECVQ